MRKIWLFPAAVLFVAGAASAAETGGDTTERVMSDCSAAALPAAAVDSCLERVRILEETDTSPGLAGLEARLEARVAADHEPLAPPPAENETVEVRPYSAGPAGAGTAADSAAATADTDAAEQATGSPRSLQAAEPAGAIAGDWGAADAEGTRAAAADTGVSPPADTTADSPPDISSEDEPPIADPPDSDAAAQTGDDDSPPGGSG